MDISVSSQAVSTDGIFQYVYMEDVESPERYHPGGYHPVAIGDHLHDRYRIVHKLGHGGYSTVWLARDQTAAKYVAIKIAVAEGDSWEGDISTTSAKCFKPWRLCTSRTGYHLPHFG
jgi:hypothetical protein